MSFTENKCNRQCKTVTGMESAHRQIYSDCRILAFQTFFVLFFSFSAFQLQRKYALAVVARNARQQTIQYPILLLR